MGLEEKGNMAYQIRLSKHINHGNICYFGWAWQISQDRKITWNYIKTFATQMSSLFFIGFLFILEFEGNPTKESDVDLFKNGFCFSVHFPRLELTMGKSWI